MLQFCVEHAMKLFRLASFWITSRAKTIGLGTAISIAKRNMKKLSKHQVEDLLKSAMQHISGPDYVLADGALIRVLESDPLQPEALRLRCLLLASMNDFAGAFSHAAVLVSVRPKCAADWRLRGELAMEVGFKHEAHLSFNQAVGLGDEESQKFLDVAGRMHCNCVHCAQRT
jgi:hypothetical protein